MRLVASLLLLVGMSACTFINPADLPELVDEKTVRADLRDQIKHRLLWLEPAQPWHLNCLFQKRIEDLNLDEQRLTLPKADMLFRAHFEDERHAFRSAGYLYRQLADQGVPLAYVELGDLLVNGDGVQVNTKGGATLILQGARLDCAQAQHRYGELLSKGTGVKSDLIQAWGWLKLAHDQGYSDSLKLMKRIENLLGPAQFSFAQQNAQQLRQQLDLFNHGENGQKLVECVTDRSPKPFVTRMLACHAMGGINKGEVINKKPTDF